MGVAADIGQGSPWRDAKVGASTDLAASKEAANVAKGAIKQPTKQVLDVANSDWSTPIFFGPFAFLPFKVKINTNQKNDRPDGDACPKEHRLNSRQGFGAFTTHLSHLVADEDSFNRTKMAIGKESPSC